MKFIIFISLIFTSGQALTTETPISTKCHVIYGGDQEDFEILPTNMYEAKAFRFHSFYRLKFELLNEINNPKLKVYIWAPYKDQDKMIHQGLYEINNKDTKRFSTGKQFIYEPDAETSLNYWCE